MIVSFCGHAQFAGNAELERRMLEWIEERVGEEMVEFYLGGYGEFDRFAYACCKKYRALHPSAMLVFVTPYLTEQYQRDHLRDRAQQFDSVVYPPIECKPLRLAILYRNRYMVECADVIVAYVAHMHGGAYQTLCHARRLGKSVFNLAEPELDTKK